MAIHASSSQFSIIGKLIHKQNHVFQVDCYSGLTSAFKILVITDGDYIPMICISCIFEFFWHKLLIPCDTDT